MVKGEQLECYKDSVDDKAEFQLKLPGAKIALADKELKKQFALKLNKDGQEICLDVRFIIFQIPMHILH